MRPICIHDAHPDLRPTAIRGVYLHIPFCFHKCHYCDFYSIVDTRDRQAAFVERMIDEIRSLGALCPPPVETMFAGGGTPTLLAPALWIGLLDAISQHIPRQNDAEFTVEANPETVTAELLDVLRTGGVNRLSIGAQSFDPRHLRTLERWHDPANVRRSVELARSAGFENINLDLICAIPGQTLDEWYDDLSHALSLGPTHISCYTLVYEPNTPMTVRLRRGEFEPIDEDVEAAMYEAAVDLLHERGYEQYEISNWARPGYRCRHNLLYWTNAQWWPLGPGACGHAGGVRWKNIPRLGDYLTSTGLPSVVDVEALDRHGRAGEELMLRLRLNEGVDSADLSRLLSESDGTDRQTAIDRAVSTGLLERNAMGIRLSRRGRLQADGVLAELI